MFFTSYLGHGTMTAFKERLGVLLAIILELMPSDIRKEPRRASLWSHGSHCVLCGSHSLYIYGHGIYSILF